MLLSSALHMQPGLTDRLHIILSITLTGPVHLKTILAHTGLHKQLLLDIHHDVLLLKRGKKIERKRKRKRKRKRERERERDCSRLTMNLLIGTSHLRLSLRVERRQAPSYLDLPQDQELLNLFLRPSPFTHTTVADPGGGVEGVATPPSLYNDL